MICRWLLGSALSRVFASAPPGSGKGCSMVRVSRVLLLGGVVVLTACATHQISAVDQEPTGTDSPPLALQPSAAPVWKVGDEWSFQYESSTAKGTFVDVVNREETVDGIECYVVRSARQEYYYRKSDLAYYLQKQSGTIIYRYMPLHSFWAWPMIVGKQWHESTTRERPSTRETEQFRLVMRIETAETITVPAGTFETFKIVRLNDRSGELDGEFWYAPAVRYNVRVRLRDNFRELTKFILQT